MLASIEVRISSPFPYRAPSRYRRGAVSRTIPRIQDHKIDLFNRNTVHENVQDSSSHPLPQSIRHCLQGTHASARARTSTIAITFFTLLSYPHRFYFVLVIAPSL